jgi:hypothetical protein
MRGRGARSGYQSGISARQAFRPIVLQIAVLVADARTSVYSVVVMDARETMNVSLGRTLLVVAASDGPPWITAN